jgi:hypothetical protein
MAPQEIKHPRVERCTRCLLVFIDYEPYKVYLPLGQELCPACRPYTEGTVEPRTEDMGGESQ